MALPRVWLGACRQSFETLAMLNRKKSFHLNPWLKKNLYKLWHIYPRGSDPRYSNFWNNCRWRTNRPRTAQFTLFEASGSERERGSFRPYVTYCTVCISVQICWLHTTWPMIYKKNKSRMFFNILEEVSSESKHGRWREVLCNPRVESLAHNILWYQTLDSFCQKSLNPLTPRSNL